MREKIIESKLCKAVKARGGLCLKFISPSFNGMPDRLVLMPSGVMAFVETKATGEILRKLQLRRKRQLESLGFRVYCLNNEMKVEEILNEIQSV